MRAAEACPKELLKCVDVGREVVEICRPGVPRVERPAGEVFLISDVEMTRIPGIGGVGRRLPIGATHAVHEVPERATVILGSQHVLPIVWGARGPTSKSKAPLLLVRVESVANGSLASRERGLVLFSRFYEWKGEKGTRRDPYAARDPHAPILALAALISSAILPDGEVREACTIITQPALGALIPIHDRMPLLVPPAAFRSWLDPTAQTRDVLEMVRRDEEQAASLIVSPEDPERVAREAREGLLF